MVKIGLADNHPVVHYGIKAYYKEHPDVSLEAIVDNFEMVSEMLKIKEIDVLLLDLELEGLSSINLIKNLLKDFPNLKIILFSNLNEQIYAPNAIKAGVFAFVQKSEKLDVLTSTIIKVNRGAVIFSDAVKKNMALISKQIKSERLYRKLSSREIEVLRYLSNGKKNKEIAEALHLNEKTISTYKLRLLAKLNVTNLVDLVNKAKTLDIV
ncbi:response regulator transcription factor [Flavobacterium psychrophilum]|uniref:response regulator transcription factor n=1 Tax=Flavobacterium psychrophilum TaxID=96345 RepID=UPI00073ECDC8|nr:response regulator transcription factor [Flavobacterium psychrophilum]MEB3378379.1 response regulator transcription factor [Flavobacterium psychrophilum]SNB06313.1 Two-component system response regulatory protein, LuxR family [Flavobacterium psychrophilum]SNB96318.1 Two-component system response regulatory protein, LuxR family [Flavobacterium psychrophilum]GAQ48690.1 helix-turn-helix transcriptional regulator [Flavobacterium psychrophilum]GAW89822.1 LuxR family transcriptional regulator [Fl